MFNPQPKLGIELELKLLGHWGGEFVTSDWALELSQGSSSSCTLSIKDELFVCDEPLDVHLYETASLLKGFGQVASTVDDIVDSTECVDEYSEEGWNDIHSNYSRVSWEDSHSTCLQVVGGYPPRFTFWSVSTTHVLNFYFCLDSAYILNFSFPLMFACILNFYLFP